MKTGFAVYRDGFRVSGIVSLDVARASIEYHRKCDNFYDLSIYMVNEDGSLVWIE